MFISSAFAQEATTAVEPSAITGLIPLVLIMIIFYFLILRPQQKRFKQHQATLNAIVKGDKVLTAGGIVGKVVKVNDADALLHLQIADNVVVEVSRPTIASVLESKQGNSLAANTNPTPKKTAKHDTAKPNAKVANDN